MVKLTQAVRFETSDKKRLTRSKDITGGVENKIKHSKLQFRFTKSLRRRVQQKITHCEVWDKLHHRMWTCEHNTEDWHSGEFAHGNGRYIRRGGGKEGGKGFILTIVLDWLLLMDRDMVDKLSDSTFLAASYFGLWRFKDILRWRTRNKTFEKNSKFYTSPDWILVVLWQIPIGDVIVINTGRFLPTPCFTYTTIWWRS